jgi:WD40 repeat protein
MSIIGTNNEPDKHLKCVSVDSGNDKITIWDLETCEFMNELSGHNGLIYYVYYTNGRVYSASYDNTIRIWDPDRLICIFILGDYFTRKEFVIGIINKPNPNNYFVIMDNGNVISGGDNNNIMLWNVKKYSTHNNKEKFIHGNVIHRSELPYNCITQLPDNQIMVGFSDGTFKILNTNTMLCMNDIHTTTLYEYTMLRRCEDGPGPFKILHANDRVIVVHFDGSLSIWK